MSTDPIDDGGPVHPCLIPVPGALHANGDPPPMTRHYGISLRDHFAGLAMQALVAQRCYPTDDQVAKWAYHVADLMLQERAK